MKNENKKNMCEFYVQGMHCASCEIVVEDSLTAHKDVLEAKANLNGQKVVVKTNDNTNLEELKMELNNLIKDLGYSLHTAPVKNEKINYTQLITAFLISVMFVGLFILLQKMGIVNMVRADKVTLPFVFLMGIIASLSTCMAVVGGLVLSLSSSYSKIDKKRSHLPLIKFHVSRLISFFLLGGLIGLVGSAFTLTSQLTFVLNLVLFLVMLVLGINLLNVIPSISKFQLRMPRFLSKSVTGNNSDTNYLAPVLLGASTFFLPCGFTQSMQVYSLTTGNFMLGALTMFVFALGTFPILAFISVASVKLANGLQSGLFFKTSGFIVLFFAIFNFIGALTALGIIKPFLNI